MAYDIGITALFLLAIVLWLRRMMEDQKLKAVLRTALRKADLYKPGGREIVTIPYNQLAELIGWKSDNFPMRENKYTGKPGGPHPSALPFTRRRKL